MWLGGAGIYRGGGAEAVGKTVEMNFK